VKLPRPYIPLAVRIQVAERQVMERPNPYFCVGPRRREGYRKKIKADYLAWLLNTLFGNAKVELHHRPALVNRTSGIDTVHGKVRYIPDANDPEHLVYLPKGEHDLETRIRGLGAQRSDLSQRRYLKKVAHNRLKRGEARPNVAGRSVVGRSKAGKAKRPWRWPKGRKLRSRAINPGWRRRRARKARGWPQSRPLGG
jgi:hypothetical protein